MRVAGRRLDLAVPEQLPEGQTLAKRARREPVTEVMEPDILKPPALPHAIPVAPARDTSNRVMCGRRIPGLRPAMTQGLAAARGRPARTLAAAGDSGTTRGPVLLSRSRSSFASRCTSSQRRVTSQTASGAAASKLRSSRLGAIAWEWRLSVVIGARRLRRGGRMPFSRMSLATGGASRCARQPCLFPVSAKLTLASRTSRSRRLHTAKPGNCRKCSRVQELRIPIDRETGPVFRGLAARWPEETASPGWLAEGVGLEPTACFAYRSVFSECFQPFRL